MKNVFRIVILPFFYIFSLFPHFVLYFLSDLSAFILNKILSYRQRVVLENIRNSFPERSEEEHLVILNRFYVHLCDLIVETLKLLSMSRRSLSKRCTFTPEADDLIQHYYKQGKSIIIVLGHFGNWEWGGPAFAIRYPYPLYVLYRPLVNVNFDAFMHHIRTRLGTRLVAMREVMRHIVSTRHEVQALAFIADQTPLKSSAYWTQFLNQETAVFIGTARIAIKTGMPVVYMSIEKVKRGYYRIHAQLITEEPGLFSEEELTDMHTRKLEEDIRKMPWYWLWSHRRWKHKRNDQ